MTTAPEGRSRGLVYILAATAVAGAAGYAIQLLAPAMLTDPVAYLTFSVFWSTMFLFVGAIAGVQQEVTRATRPATENPHSATLRTFTLVSIGVLVALTIAVGFLLAPVAFSSDVVGMTLWFGVGIIGYILIAVLAGVLYGLSLWRAIAGLTIADALIRGILVSVGLLLGVPPTVLAGLIAAPFVLAFGLVWLAYRRRVVGRFHLDVGARRLSLNSLSTVTAAAATGVMVTGLPLLLRLTMPETSPELLASVVVVITITRAPLIIPLMALQSFLIVSFKAAGRAVWAPLIRYLLLTALVTGIASCAAYSWGPWVIDSISGGRYQVEPIVIAGIVASAGLVALLCLTGPASLSENRHLVYVAGWVVAAFATIGLLLVPIEPVTRTMVALLAAPAMGIIVHLIGVRPGDATKD